MKREGQQDELAMCDRESLHTEKWDSVLEIGVGWWRRWIWACRSCSVEGVCLARDKVQMQDGSNVEELWALGMQVQQFGV